METESRPRLPAWLRGRLPTAQTYAATQRFLDELHLHTVCQSARCPNQWECWSRGTATFMIGGDRCTRACRFCAVTTARPFALDPDEPARVAEAARRMRLRHVVITSVARDDLPDGGAAHFARTVAALRGLDSGLTIEVLTPDFNESELAMDTVLAAGPHVFNHNLETVRRLTSAVRSRATYDRSLNVLRLAKARGARGLCTKSGLMLGLGETEDEVLEALRDLRAVGCDRVTLGQYLQPTRAHLPVVEFVTPERFAEFDRQARALGFLHVSCGPRVRSSYNADDFAPCGEARS